MINVRYLETKLFQRCLLVYNISRPPCPFYSIAWIFWKYLFLFISVYLLALPGANKSDNLRWFFSLRFQFAEWLQQGNIRFFWNAISSPELDKPFMAVDIAVVLALLPLYYKRNLTSHSSFPWEISSYWCLIRNSFQKFLIYQSIVFGYLIILLK